MSDDRKSAAARAPRIAVLSEHVKNQIAAGEVIERPASALKELVENALDAGSTHLVIDLEEGGAKLVRVTDDGVGMSRADLELAFVPHATSKLATVDDLEHIASLGFRGEALASMGAVARCSIRTRERESLTGWRIEDEGGRLSAAIEAGSPAGTCVEVRDLFYNVPARRRFLKTPATELGRCLDVVQRLALAHVGVGFVVNHDGRRVFDVEAGMDLRARIRRAFGAELADALQEVEARDGDLVLTGYVAPPRFARSDTSRQMWFLNGRALKDKVLLRALKEGYRGFLFETRQPVAFLVLSMDPSRVDVNVHPAKSEVRFRDERRLFGFVVAAVRAAVARMDLATPAERLVDTALERERRAGPDLWSAANRSRAPAEPFVVRDLPGGSPSDTERAPVGERELGASGADARAHGADERLDAGALAAAFGALEARATSTEWASATERAPRPRGRYLQIARTYLVHEVDGGFEIVDQHALHERITYEALAADLRRGAFEVQRLLVPELVELAPHEVALVVARAEELAAIGIELDAFGTTTIAVHALPARLARPKPAAIVREIVAVLEEGRAPSRERLLEEVLHRAACRSSVMAGDPLTDDEITALFERGAALLNDQTCVHGRPTRVRFTLADLERAFLRRA
ncbi:MAG: DNA mismatch repair endonuclease MutL [Planctomycetota bacterium]